MTENSNIVVATEETVIELSTEETAAQKRGKIEASQDRIAYEQNMLVTKQARLTILKPGTPSYAACERSIEVTKNFIMKLEASLAARLAKQAAPKAPRAKQVRFDIEVEAANESDPEHVLSSTELDQVG